MIKEIYLQDHEYLKIGEDTFVMFRVTDKRVKRIIINANKYTKVERVKMEEMYGVMLNGYEPRCSNNWERHISKNNEGEVRSSAIGVHEKRHTRFEV